MSSYFLNYGPPPSLGSFPTRRSSDLAVDPLLDRALLEVDDDHRVRAERRDHEPLARGVERHVVDALVDPRSEEHTSELQSHSDLVCRLLLEKKNGRAAQSANDLNPRP